MKWGLVAVALAACSHPDYRYPTIVVTDAERESSCDRGAWRDCNEYATSVETGARHAGQLLPPNPQRARALFTRACDLGNGTGCYNLGRSLDRTGAERARVEKLYADACDLGEDGGCSLANATPDIARALVLYRASCERGDQASCVLVGKPTTGETTVHAEDRCSMANSMLAREPTYDVSRPIPVANLAIARSYRKMELHTWGSAARELHDSPMGTTTLDLERCVARFREREAYIAKLDERIRFAELEGEARASFAEAVAPARETIWRMVLVQLQLDGDRAKRVRVEDLLAGLTPEDATRMLAQLANVEDACAKTLPGAGAQFPTVPDSSVSHDVIGVQLPSALGADPETWCYVARNRVALMHAAVAAKPFLDAAHREALLTSLWTNPSEELLVMLSDPSAFERHYLEEAQRWYSAIGEALPDDPIPRVKDFGRELRSRVDRMRRSSIFDHAVAHDSRIEQLARAAFAAPDVTILASALDSPSFKAIDGDDGVHLQRWRAGRVVLHRGKMPWCEEHTFSYVEPFEHGRYQASRSVAISRPALTVACH